ncbi:MAG: NAD(P)/FAD-dependent oxidoreductase [Verrucomicrobiota bacterium]
MSSLSFDVVVIGGGSAGYAAARTASDAGAAVAVVEGGSQVGGLCILRGCMPSKSLLESSHRWAAIRDAKRFGLEAEPVRAHIDKIVARKNKLIGEFADYRRGQLEKGNFTFLRGNATFSGPNAICLRTDGDEQEITAKSFVITTGSIIPWIPIKGLAETGFINSDQALNLTTLPESVVVLGGGVIAVELGQYFLGLGSKVTLIQRSPQILSGDDRDVADELAAALRAAGMTIHTGTKLLEAKVISGNKAVVFEHEGKKKTIKAEEIFYALGRVPHTINLGLDAARVKMDGQRIAVDAAMRTSQRGVFAAGDVTGLYEIVHIAIQQGEVAGHNAALAALGKTKFKGKVKAPRKMDYRLKASVVFTEPEVASVGLSEREAKERKIPHYVATYPFNDHGKSIIMGAEHGFVKILAEKKRGEIIGAQIVGPHAADLIHEFIAVMRYKGTVAELAEMPHYHPTLAEIITYPAEEIVEKMAKPARKPKAPPGKKKA